MTSLEKILKKHKIPAFDLFKLAKGKPNQFTMWRDKFAGERLITPKEAENINAALQVLGVNEKVKYAIDKYLIV